VSDELVADVEFERLRDRARPAGLQEPEIALAGEVKTVPERACWQTALAKKGRQGAIVGDERNVLAALRTAPDLRGLWRFDEFSLKVELTKVPPWRDLTTGAYWTDDDDTALTGYLQEQGVPVRSKNMVADCVSLVAKDSRVHPVREYLGALEWDRTERLDSWLTTYLGADGPPQYLRAVGRCWLISAVARVEAPGCQADHSLVLEALQGAGKSSAARILAVKPNWFADSIGDLRNKDAAIVLSGKWVIELSELSSTRRAEVEPVKAYLSRTHDTFRPPYGRRAITIPRQCVFIGTTNEGEYLHDKTGNRRYWPVLCQSINLTDLERDRDQLWAEAVHCYRAGEKWHLSNKEALLAAEEQESRVPVTELEADVAEYLAQLGKRQTEITAREVFVNALKLDPNSGQYAEQTARLGARVAAAIKRAGYSKVGTRGRGKTKRTVYRRTESHQEKLRNSLANARTDEEWSELHSASRGECPICSGSGCDECGDWKGPGNSSP